MPWISYSNSKSALLPLKSLGLILFLIFICFPLLASSGGGLKLHGNEQPIAQRTSYDVFGDKTVRFSANYSIEFDLSLYPTTEIGYIIRIKNRENNRIYNLFYDGQGDQHLFKFNEEGTNNLIVAAMDKETLFNLQWFQMKIAFDLKSDAITLTIHDQTFEATSKDLPDSYSPIILFGKSDHIIDVPTFGIKDLSVGNHQDKYVFPLKEIEGNTVHEASGKSYGQVSNPEWLMNDAYHWRHQASFQFQSVAGANYNPEKKEIYYFNQDSLLIYNVRSGETQIKVFEEQCPVPLVLGSNFIDTVQNKIYAYEVYYEQPYGGPTVASLDLDTFQWTAESQQQLPTQLHHHGPYLDPSTGHYTLFGGFGNMRYSKNFFSYSLEQKEWKALEGFTGDRISPRYFSSVGYLKATNSIYIFGGMGNESGEQTLGRRYYYDLYKVDLNTNHITKLWEIPWEKDNMVPVRGMVILDDSSFYTLCYPEHFSESQLQLYRFSLKDGSYEILGDSLPIYSDKITTNANLYYDHDLHSLYTVVQEFEDDIASDLKVYSLTFPPVTAEELASYANNKRDKSWVKITLWLLLALGVGYVLFRKLKPKDSLKENEVQIGSIPTPKTETANQPNAIYLFGEFTVRDRKNRDVTYLFSAQLKQLFCLVLQYTSTEGGITSQRLSNILWPDKPADKVKNSRGVSINHLRKALSELDGIELIYEKGHFKISPTEAFYCDYLRCLQIISTNDIGEHRREFIEILSRGKFLQLFDHPLFDSFKEEMEKKLEPVLLLEVEKSFAAKLYPETVALSEALFNIDPLNDTALTFQVKAMQKLKLNEEAQVKYQAFVIEYKKVMGSEYPHTFKDLS